MRASRVALLIVIVAALGAVAYYYYYLPMQRAKTGEASAVGSDTQGAAAGKRAGGGGGQKRGAGQDGPVPVVAVAVKSTDVPIYLFGVGTVQAYNSVTVHAQVSGKLLSVPFREGQDVKKGDLLAQIDPALFQAAYDQAVAKKAQDEALLANARLDLARYTKLAQQNYGSQQQADTQRALVAQDEALVKFDQATIESAKTNLDYCRITSPIDGRTGIRQVDVGNIVQPSDANGIVVVSQLKPITVVFTLPEQQLAQVMAASDGKQLTADSLSGDNRKVLDHGTMEVIDNMIDQTTGMIRFKATTPNAKLQLWPGQFVNVRLLIDTRRDAIVVSPGAVQQGPTGTYVYVVGQDSVATVRPVTVAQQDDTVAVISDGLKAGDMVVTSGFVRLTNGAKVTIAKPEGNRTGNSAESNASGTRARTPAAGQGTTGQGTTGSGQPEAGAAPPAGAAGAATGTRAPNSP